MRQLNWRRVVSLSLLLLAAVLTVTGLVLYVAPAGRIAYWSDWHLLGLDKEQLGAIHTTSSFAFVVLGWLHTWYNWKAIVGYLRDKARKLRVLTPEMIAASVLVGVLVVGTGLSWPPFAQVMDAGAAAKDWWEEREGSPPYGHAELSSLATIAGKLGLEPQAAAAALRADGWVVEGPDSSLLDIGRHNDRSPAALYAALTALGGGPAPEATQQAGHHAAGMGKRTLAEHCEAEGLELERVVTLLGGRGLEAKPGSSLKDLATELGMTPADLAAWVAEAPPSR
jgi:hypothetical protein